MAVPFVFVTGNPNKKIEVERILGQAIETVDVDLPEIQSNDLLEVLHAKGQDAWQRVRRPLVVEETGLGLEALNGFPGPLIKWWLERTGAEGVARTAIALGDPRVTASCALLYLDEHGSVVALGEAPGRLVLPSRGEEGFGWDPVFVPEGQDLTCAELGTSVKDRVGHRGRAWHVFSRLLAEQRGISLTSE